MTPLVEHRSVPPILSVDSLVIDYKSGATRTFRAVDGVSIAVGAGDSVGLVGESGSGKSTIGRAILGLTPVAHGKVVFKGEDITKATRRRRQKLSNSLQVIFQDPYSSLNPTKTIATTLGESLKSGRRRSRNEVSELITEVLHSVGMPADAADRYPTQFSGGQRQRIAIARALINRPELVVCDEAVSALDLSVQAQVLNLLRRLQRELGLSYLFITHDLAVVRHFCDSVVVLYRGQVMESGPADLICTSPNHPYTIALTQASPVPHPEIQRARRLAKKADRDPTTLPRAGNGCPFVTRCAFAEARCHDERPALEETGRGNVVACHRWREIEAATQVAKISA